MRALEDYLSKNHPIPFIYRPAYALFALIASCCISGAVLWLQVTYDNTAKSIISQLTLVFICTAISLAWLVSLSWMDKPKFIRRYRRQQYQTILMTIFAIIAIGPYLLLPLKFEQIPQDFPSVIAVFATIMSITVMSSSGSVFDVNIIGGRLCALFVFIVFALLRWFGAPWFLIGFLLAIISGATIYSVFMSICIWKKRGSLHSLLTSAGFIIITFTLVASFVSFFIIVGQRLGLTLREPVDLSVLASSKIVMILAEITIFPAVLCGLITVATIEIGRLASVYYSDLPRE